MPLGKDQSVLPDLTLLRILDSSGTRLVDQSAEWRGGLEVASRFPAVLGLLYQGMTMSRVPLCGVTWGVCVEAYNQCLCEDEQEIIATTEYNNLDRSI